MKRNVGTVGALLGGLLGTVACTFLCTTPAQAFDPQCLSKRANAAGHYQRCVQKWQSRCFGGSVCDQGRLSKCREKYAAVWPNLQAVAGASCGVGPRFVDNGNGTVTDNLTGLVWEKKDDASGIHDKDNVYTWGTGAPYAETGSAFTGFLSSLNGGAFAGANGWRLPTFAELQTILLPEPYPCTTNPCIDAAFGAVQSDVYWSATTFAANPSGVWLVYFADGTVASAGKTSSFNYYVRAVRGGL